MNTLLRFGSSHRFWIILPRVEATRLAQSASLVGEAWLIGEFAQIRLVHRLGLREQTDGEGGLATRRLGLRTDAMVELLAFLRVAVAEASSIR